jgi:AmmeMemoRadiSam system protein B
MPLRSPAVAGSFYPGSSNALKETLDGFLGKKQTKMRCIGAVVPHAGYEFCGKVAASVYGRLDNFDTAVIIGPNHTGLGVGVATTSQGWKTPLGTVEADTEFIEALKGKTVMDDPLSHIREHSIEVQLPWIQHLFPKVKIAPISVNPIYFDIDNVREIGNAVANAISKTKRNAVIIASSDFTHYGSAYAYEPYVGRSAKDILDIITKTDKEAIDMITSLRPDDLVRFCDDNRLTICGYGCIAAMLHASIALGAKKGELLDYSTSYDVSRDENAIVGYAGIAVQ